MQHNFDRVYFEQGLSRNLYLAQQATDPGVAACHHSLAQLYAIILEAVAPVPAATD
ncbi:hypothetical protein GGR44_002753 [Sphingobium fontiphilum]|uniref:Uncharacterized protein n=1 Tax=Sphingobium fontiphilum TaxID=944425 RepID=A0A7W6GQ36_9SPHN|nr:hypothetical protein [Sphingobium fontiphilum]MBB3983073.1 hypothetical protein [Sphingobium fontiphilum]